MDTFLRVNGYALTLSDEQAYEFVLRVVQGQLEKDEFVSELERGVVKA